MEKNISAFIGMLNSRRFDALAHFDDVIYTARKNGVNFKSEREIDDALLDAVQALKTLAEAVTELHRKNTTTEQAAD